MRKKIMDLLDQKRTSNSLYLLIASLIILSFLFVIGGEGDLTEILGRILGFIIIMILAYSLVDWSIKVTENTERWTEDEELDEDINLRIQDVSELLRRASEGKEKSQEILHKRLKKIFFVKLKEKKDISRDDIRDLIRKPEELRKVVKDEVISDFILSTEKKSSKTDIQRRKSKRGFLSSSKKNDPEKYKEKIKEIIQRINSWGEAEYD
ncbi:MAG: hypothetical protein KGY66_06000 [Candidatus Thermoplasmatota archaeon]|nr:hypothetical protein [Candidatus Thermoplasmatota archaeon]